LTDEPSKAGSIKGVFTKKNYFFQTGPEAIGEELSIDVPIDLDYRPFLDTLTENFRKVTSTPSCCLKLRAVAGGANARTARSAALNGISMNYRP
jgi:hypothetical protein